VLLGLSSEGETGGKSGAKRRQFPGAKKRGGGIREHKKGTQGGQKILQQNCSREPTVVLERRAGEDKGEREGGGGSNGWGRKKKNQLIRCEGE